MAKKRGEGGLIQAGEILPIKVLAKKFGPPTRAQLQLIEFAATIREQPDAAEAAFMARQLVQCTLPHANPGNVPLWTRTNGNLTLGIQQGYDLKSGKPVGYPFGSIPRLLLFWITTEAVQTKKRRLELGKSLSAFMREIGLDPYTGRGKRGDATRLREQMRRLFAAHISFEQTMTENDRHGQRWLHMHVAPKGEMWWDPKQPLQDDLWGSWIELGDDFFTAITSSPVPVDMRALRALKRSPLALDLYAWAGYRAFTVTKKGKPQFIPWTGLMSQLGTDYAEQKDFKRYAKAALRKVQAVFPGLHLTHEQGGITIHPSRPAILPKHPN